MSDLISRKAVLAYIRERHNKITIERNQYSENSFSFIDGMKAENESFNDFIMLLPTSYDVDKVVEQLEDNMKDEGVRFADQVVRRAVNVVKGGLEE